MAMKQKLIICKKKKRYFNQKSFIKGAIRRLFSRSPQMLEVLNNLTSSDLEDEGIKKFLKKYSD